MKSIYYDKKAKSELKELSQLVQNAFLSLIENLKTAKRRLKQYE